MMHTLQFRILQHLALTPKLQQSIKLPQQLKLKFNLEIKRITGEELTGIKR